MKKTALALAVLSTFAFASAPATAGEAELAQRIDQLANELQQLKAELAAERKKTAAVEQRQETLAASQSQAEPRPESERQTVLTGYGELNYTRPTHDASKAQADVARAVIGIEHRFDDKSHLVSEFEWEHAVASQDDSGETEVEQMYVEREFGNGLRAKAGLFLIPSGLLNTNHEPTAYYGVQRNFVETAIIPSTWREAGLGLSKTLDNGLTVDAGVTTGFDLTKWDFSADSEAPESTLGSIHQEGQLAKSRNLALHGALNWRGVPGLLLGGSVFTGKAGHATEGFAANDARITLWEVHGRYNPGRWDLSALAARGTISNTAALNLANAGNPTPVPSSFQGWYAQAAYQLWQSGDYTLSPFVRYEQFNTAKTYESQPAGLGTSGKPDSKVATVGANLRVGEGVVLKADYQKFRDNSALDRVDLGFGYAF